MASLHNGCLWSFLGLCLISTVKRRPSTRLHLYVSLNYLRCNPASVHCTTKETYLPSLYLPPTPPQLRIKLNERLTARPIFLHRLVSTQAPIFRRISFLHFHLTCYRSEIRALNFSFHFITYISQDLISSLSGASHQLYLHTHDSLA